MARPSRSGFRPIVGPGTPAPELNRGPEDDYVPVADSDWVACERHWVQYRGPTCPACAADSDLRRAKVKLGELNNAIKLLQRDKAALRAQLTHLDSMRMAFELMEPSDRVALKEMLYRWRQGAEPINLAHREERFTSKNGAGVRHVVAGFASGDEKHLCVSVGGVAMARALSEATKLVGREEATLLLAKAMAPSLAPPRSDT